MNNVLGIIPARKGSKGIYKKNLVNLGGKPLIQWSIVTGLGLLKSGAISRLIVSTDCAEIAKVARGFGAEVPFIRPAELARDNSKTADTVIHALKKLKSRGKKYDATLLLQPTCPLRDEKAIKKSIKRFLSQTKSKSMISCYEDSYINTFVLYQQAGKERLRPLHSQHNSGMPRQEQKKMMVRNGSIYMTRVPFLLRTKKLICNNPLLLRMPKKLSFNLDTIEDLIKIKQYLCELES